MEGEGTGQRPEQEKGCVKARKEAVIDGRGFPNILLPLPSLNPPIWVHLDLSQQIGSKGLSRPSRPIRAMKVCPGAMELLCHYLDETSWTCKFPMRCSLLVQLVWLHQREKFGLD